MSSLYGKGEAPKVMPPQLAVKARALKEARLASESEDLRIRETGDSPFLSDGVFAKRAAAGRIHTSEEYLQAAQACIRDGEIEVVREYFIGSGLVFLSQLELSDEIQQHLMG